ncbi:MAG: WD40 repeat domain-containing protein [Endomicrobiales bacterium]|nr:WD40 repeat domain-containing protein [Endomicrobiales bacterium]
MIKKRIYITILIVGILLLSAITPNYADIDKLIKKNNLKEAEEFCKTQKGEKQKECYVKLAEAHYAHGNLDKTVEIYEKLKNQEKVDQILEEIGDYYLSIGKFRSFKGFSQYTKLSCVALSLDNKYIAAAGSEATQNPYVRVWDFINGKEIQSFLVTAKDIYDIAITPDNKFILVSCISDDKKDKKSKKNKSKILLYELKTGKEKKTLVKYPFIILKMLVSSNSKYLIFMTEDSTIQIATLNGNVKKVLMGSPNKICSLAISYDSKYLLAGFDDNTIQLWELETGKEMGTLEGHASWVLALAISHDNRYIASGSKDTKIKLWDAYKWGLVHTFDNSSKNIRCITFSPDGKYLLSGGDDAYIRVWELDSKQLIKEFKAHNGLVRDVLITNNNKYIISIGDDNAVKATPIQNPFELALEYYQKAGYDGDYIFNKLSEKYKKLLAEKHFTQVEFDDMINYYIEVGYPQEKVYIMIADILYEKEKYNKAQEYYKKAANYFGLANDSDGEKLCYKKLVIIYDFLYNKHKNQANKISSEDKISNTLFPRTKIIDELTKKADNYHKEKRFYENKLRNVRNGR